MKIKSLNLALVVATIVTALKGLKMAAFHFWPNVYGGCCGQVLGKIAKAKGACASKCFLACPISRLAMTFIITFTLVFFFSWLFSTKCMQGMICCSKKKRR